LGVFFFSIYVNNFIISSGISSAKAFPIMPKLITKQDTIIKIRFIFLPPIVRKKFLGYGRIQNNA